MVQTCVDRNMSIDGGELGIEPWSLPRHVMDQTVASTGDGAFTQQTDLPGKLMIDSGILTWTSDSPLPAMMLVRVQRLTRSWQVSNPNIVQIRDRYTTSIGSTDPRLPETSSTFQGQSGGGIDVGTNSTSVPLVGRLWVYEDAHITEEWLGPVPPGEDFNIWYRCYLWTPPPWSNNANNNSPTHTATVNGARIQLIAFPTVDTAIAS